MINYKEIRIYQVDAFTDKPFSGNPTAVCILEEELDDSTLQLIAGEMNLSETAFLYTSGIEEIKDMEEFKLRWFTPEVEVPLCGHATLATSAVLFYEIGVNSNEVSYRTKSGILKAVNLDDGIMLDFPSNPVEKIEAPIGLMDACGLEDWEEVFYSKKLEILLIRISDEEFLKNLLPDFEKMKRIETKGDILGVIITARSEHPYDFVSRFFAPWCGINEDPVTGAAHTVLTPYWATILKKKEMFACQVSKRGGEIRVRLNNGRVNLTGEAVIVLKGNLSFR